MEPEGSLPCSQEPIRALELSMGMASNTAVKCCNVIHLKGLDYETHLTVILNVNVM
jgi:hypothetical protein